MITDSICLLYILFCFQCVVCLCAKASMQTMPCGHKVVCRKCFVKTIQVAVTQRCLPLRCVVCRTRILKLKQEVNTAPMTPPTQRYSRLLPCQEQSPMHSPVHHLSHGNRHQPPSFTQQFVRSQKHTAALTRSPGAWVRYPNHHRYDTGVTCPGATGSNGIGTTIGLFDSKQQPVLICNEFKKPHHHPMSSLTTPHHVPLSPARGIQRNTACTNNSQKKHRTVTFLQ